MKVINKHYIEYNDKFGNHVITEVEERNPLKVISEYQITNFHFFDEQEIVDGDKTIKCGERINYSYEITKGRRITLYEAKGLCNAAMRFQNYQPIFKPETILAEIYRYEDKCKTAILYDEYIIAGDINMTYDEIINNNIQYVGNKEECKELIKNFEQQLLGNQRK